MLIGTAAQAQIIRPSESIYVLLRGSVAGYYGDLDGDPNTTSISEGFDDPGFGVGGEVGYLPMLEISGLESSVLQLIDESTEEIIYTVRVPSSTFRPKIFDTEASYTIIIGEPGTSSMRTFTGMKMATRDGEKFEVVF